MGPNIEKLEKKTWENNVKHEQSPFNEYGGSRLRKRKK